MEGRRREKQAAIPHVPRHGDAGAGQGVQAGGGLGEEPAFPWEICFREGVIIHRRRRKGKKTEQKLSDRVTSTIPLRSQSPRQKQGRSRETYRGEFSRYPLAFRCPTFDTPAGIFKAAEGRRGTIPASLQKSQGVQSLQINKEKVMR